MAGKTSTDPNVFILPDLGEGVHEAELISWKVKPGDVVKEHDILAEMETDKALVEVPSPRDGVIKTIHGDEGEILKVGNALVSYEGGDAASEAAPAAPAKSEPAPAEAAASEDAGTVVGVSPDSMPGMGSGGKALATPAVRRMARDLGVDLAQVAGTGIGGRITKKDVEQFSKSGGANAKPAAAAPSAPAETRRPLAPAPQQQYTPQPYPQQAPMQQPYPAQPYPQQAPMQQQMQPGYGMPPAMPQMPMMWVPMPMPMPYPGMGGGAGVPQAPGYTASAPRPIPGPAQQSQVSGGQGTASVPFRGVRRTIADRLRQSVNTAVHFTVVDEADVAALDALRKQIAAQTGEKLSFLPFVARAVSKALTEGFGALNATVDEQAQEIVQHGAVHLGIATDTDSGLMVPVIRNAHAMDPVALGRAITETATSARDRSIPRDRLMGSTFTISNVGSHAGKFATPVINSPEVAILAVGKAYDAVVVRDGQAVVSKLMPLSLACDHRVVDGATAALCLAKLCELLSNPEQLL